MVSVSLDSLFIAPKLPCTPAHDHAHTAARLVGVLCSLANSPACARRKKSAMALSVKYGRPAMFTVESQPFLRQRQAVTSEIPACSQNLWRLKMGLPSIGKFGSVFTM